MAEIEIPGGNPFSWKEFNNDCKTYHEAKERLKKIGVNTEQDAIVYLQREVDYYRDKIRHMEERNKMRTDAVDAFKYATMSVMPAEAIQVKIPILESIPKDMRDRIYSIEQTADGNVTVYFDIAEKETKNNEYSGDNSSKDDMQEY